MRQMISMSAPDIDDQDIAAVVEVLRSGRLSLGPKIEAFEEALSQYIGVRYAVAVSSGTAALHLIVKALGAEYAGQKVGQFGDAAAFAFYPNKQITTGEGGLLVTNDSEVARIARSMRNQGRDEMGSWLEHERLGFNYRMDEMSAALGLS